jgi:hypothetical protein
MAYNVTVSGKEFTGIDKVQMCITGENKKAKFYAGGKRDDFIAGSITEFESDSNFVPNGVGGFTRAYAFYGLRSLAKVSCPNLTNLPTSTFESCEKLTDVDLPAVTSIGQKAFNLCVALPELVMPAVKGILDNAFNGCESLAKADFPVLTSIGNGVFNNNKALVTLILRAESVCTLANTSSFTNTPIESGTGYIYVRSALVDSYKAASNWSTYAAQFRAIEDYPDICG